MRDDTDPTLHGAYTAPADTDDAAMSGRTERVDVPRPAGSSRVALIFVAVAAASFLVGIGTASVTRPDDSDPELAAADVGPSGGTIRFEGGEVRVPDDALSQAVRISVHRSVVDRRVSIDAGKEEVVYEPDRLVAYRFLPADVTFRESVEITFRLPSGARNGTAFALRPDGSVALLAGTLDADRGTAAIEVTDFRFRGRQR
jgi:hypothetical protein